MEPSPEPRAPNPGDVLVRLQPLIHAVLARLTRDEDRRCEVAQRVAVRLLRNPRSFEHVADVAAYVARVARNEWLRFVEEEAGRRRLATPHDAAGEGASTPGGDCRPFDRDDFRCLLEPRERVVFDTYLELAAIRAVAARLGLDVRQVRRSLAKIGVTLRVFMLQNDGSCPP